MAQLLRPWIVPGIVQQVFPKESRVQIIKTMKLPSREDPLAIFLVSDRAHYVNAYITEQGIRSFEAEVNSNISIDTLCGALLILDDYEPIWSKEGFLFKVHHFKYLDGEATNAFGNPIYVMNNPLVRSKLEELDEPNLTDLNESLQSSMTQSQFDQSSLIDAMKKVSHYSDTQTDAINDSVDNITSNGSTNNNNNIHTHNHADDDNNNNKSNIFDDSVFLVPSPPKRLLVNKKQDTETSGYYHLQQALDIEPDSLDTCSIDTNSSGNKSLDHSQKLDTINTNGSGSSSGSGSGSGSSDSRSFEPLTQRTPPNNITTSSASPDRPASKPPSCSPILHPATSTQYESQVDILRSVQSALVSQASPASSQSSPSSTNSSQESSDRSLPSNLDSTEGVLRLISSYYVARGKRRKKNLDSSSIMNVLY